SSGALLISGGVVDLGGTTQTQNGGFTLTGGGNIRNGTLIASSFNLQSGIVTATLAGSASVNVTQSNDVVLRAANTFTGGLFISSNNVFIQNSGTLGSPSGA